MIELGKIVEGLGEKVVGDLGEPLGLSGETSIKLAKSLAANASKGVSGAVKAAAEETGVAQELVQSFADKLYEKGKDMLIEQSGMNEHVENAKQGAMAALKNAGGGLLGGLFGKK